MTSETTDSGYQGEHEKNFISQLLVEMKSQFNKFEKKSECRDLAEDNKNEDSKIESNSSHNSSEPSVSGHESPVIVRDPDFVKENPVVKVEMESPENTSETDDTDEAVLEKTETVVDIKNVKTEDVKVEEAKNEIFAKKSEENGEVDVLSSDVDMDDKPLMEIKKEFTNFAPQPSRSLEVKRSRKKNADTNPDKFKMALKRSKRHRSKESILQSAIARKEKYYNEAVKPQRLTRQIKPTQKVLENMGTPTKRISRNRKYSEDEIESDQEESDTSSNNKKSSMRNGKGIKREGTSDSEDSILQKYQSVGGTPVGTPKRRSQRISSKIKEEINSENASPESCLADEAKHSPSAPECSTVTAELIASRLCLCTQNTTLYRRTDDKEEVFCTAVDGIGDKLIGCTRLVDCEKSPMLRSSQRMPYGVFCDLHKNRLVRHNCCPTCGVFCTEGKFVECDSKHQYHKNCQVSVGNLECCPHCGVSSAPKEIIITMHATKKIFLPTQKSYCGSAKMSFHAHENFPSRSNSPIISLEHFENLTSLEPNGQQYDENDLIEAVANENIEKVATIIASSLDLNFKLTDFNEGTLLHFAAQAGLLPIVHLLVTSKMEIDEFDSEQNTPLMLAIAEGKNDMVHYFVKSGAGITLKGTDGMTPLHLAAKSGNLEACQILVKAGSAILNYVNNQDDGGWTPLVWACEHGFLDVATFLILKGADPSLRDVEHNIALHWAAFSGSTDIAELLLNVGCDVNTVNAHGDTPLHIAAREERYNCSIVLLARGSNISIVNKNSETALDCAPEGSDTCNIIALNVKIQSMPGLTEKRKSILTNDISRGREMNPIQCVNTEDAELEPKDFVYITKNRVTSDNVLMDTKFSNVHSCNCDERCVGEECICARISLKCWYDQDGKLKPDFNFNDAPLIFECNETCSCNAITCINRVVQKGYTQRFQVFRTESKGWGVKTLRSISKGSYVCEYVGEILTDSDGELREDDSYLFDLDNRDVNSFCIDAKYYGNFARFINHSCDPNLHPVKVFIEHQDLRFPRIALFARRDILANEELSFDYGDKFWLIKYKSFTCDCGTESCKYSEVSIDETLEKYKELMDTS